MNIKILKNIIESLPDDYEINIYTEKELEFIKTPDNSPFMYKSYYPIIQVLLNEETKSLLLKTDLSYKNK